MSAAVCPAPMQQDNSGSNHRQDQRYFLPSSEDLPSLDAPLFSPALAAAFALPYGSMTAFGSDGMLAAMRARSSGGVGGSGVGSGGAATMPLQATNAAAQMNGTAPTMTPNPGADAAAAQQQQQAAHAHAQAAAAAAAATNPFAYNVYGGGPYGGPPTPYGGLYFDSSAAALGAFFPPLRERELRAVLFENLLALLFRFPSPCSLRCDILCVPEWKSGRERERVAGFLRHDRVFKVWLAFVDDDLIIVDPLTSFSFSLFPLQKKPPQATRPTAAGATRSRWRPSSSSPPRRRRDRWPPRPRHSSSSSSKLRLRLSSELNNKPPPLKRPLLLLLLLPPPQ